MSAFLIWSIVLDISLLIPALMLGQKMRSAWLWYIFSNALWIIFSIQFQAWGLIPGSIIFSIIYLRNWYKWKT